jgi:hypothetical protein
MKEIECSESDILKKSKYGENYRALRLEKGQEIKLLVKL